MTIDPTERQEQKDIFDWAKKAKVFCPELELLYATTNKGGGGIKGGASRRSASVAGLKNGVPDICLPVARTGFHGLYVELKKRHGGKVSPEQEEWLRKLQEQGYKAVIAKGADEAIEIILDYMEVSGGD